MSKQKKPKELIYKESNNFAYTPKYEYPASILNRFLFFWETGKHWKKAVNKSIAFSKPNNICVVYLVGDVKIEQVAKYIDGKERLLVLYSNSVQPIIDKYESGAEYRSKAIIAFGKKNIADLDVTFKKYSDAVQNGYMSADDDFFVELTGEYNAINEEPKLIETFQQEWFTSLQSIGCYTGAFDSEPESHIVALTHIAQAIFPFGIEVANPPVLAYKSARREKLTISGLAKESQFGFKPDKMNEEQSPIILMYDGKLYKDAQDKRTLTPIATFENREEAARQTGVDDNAIWRCCVGRTTSVKCGDKRVAFEEQYRPESISYLLVQHIREVIHRRLYEQGGISVNEFKKELGNAPWGYYESNWYTYLFAVAISELNDDGKHRVQLGCAVFNLDSESLKYAALLNLEQNMGKVRRSYDAVLLKQNDKQNKTMDMVKRLFGIKTDVDSFQSLLMQVRIWLTENVKFGCIDIVFPELHDLLAEHKEGSYMSQGYEQKLYDLLKASYKEIKVKVNDIDNLTQRYIESKYNKQFADKYQVYVGRTYDNCHARSWVWSKDVLLREMEWLNSHAQCCECEKVIDRDVVQLDGGKDLIFHERDIIGVNRKLFGREITKFYCIPCMCDVLECSAQDIADKIAQFKEEGCKLFG